VNLYVFDLVAFGISPDVGQVLSFGGNNFLLLLNPSDATGLPKAMH
jgi:hypothetical protein